MQKLIVKLAPNSTLALIATFLAIELVVVVGAVGTVLLLFEDPLDELHLTALTALVISGPISWLMLSSLRHQRKLQDDLLRLATTDMLTGLPNRRAFLDRVGPGGRIATSGALILADADHFKKINDTHGHEVGDICLKGIADRISASRTEDDMIARYGGEEFALFIRGQDANWLRSLERQICGPHRVACDLLGREFLITLSAGAVIVPEGVSTPEAFREADKALYRAKASGRARLVIAADVPPAAEPRGRDLPRPD